LVSVATAAGANVIFTSYNPEVASYNYGDDYSSVFANIRNSAQPLASWEYNSLGMVTKSVDGANRTFSYVYDTNNIDMLQIKETLSSGNYQLGAWTWSAYHRPLSYTDESGQKTHYDYNS
jgi:hypothetical protein